MVATFGEVTGLCALGKLRDSMKSNNEGKLVLEQKPIIRSHTLDLAYLDTLPNTTFGKAYVTFLNRNQVSPDTRAPVLFIADPELAYVMDRYRQIHDFIHTLLNLSTSLEEEIALKWFEMIHFGLPVAVLSSLIGPLRLTSDERRRLRSTYIPWAVKAARACHPLMNVYYERHMTDHLEELRQHLNVIALR